MPRIAVLDKSRCKNKIGCPFICADVCPVNRAGDQCIIEGYDAKPIINEELCVGCGICTKKCPFEAIAIINLPAQLEQPIHRYGKNGFVLYSLPVPMDGKVVGIVGVNGIGKSTAVKILSGVLKANLGKEGYAASSKELAELFRGKEIQSFFESAAKGAVKVSYKPQWVDALRHVAKGKIKKLLQKIDERQAYDEVVSALELQNFVDEDIRKLAGGELQRVAIAAAALKKAKLYIFDEPTSYLDIKQRLAVSRFIRKLAAMGAAVIVIEHDLITLDHLADFVHIMYGKGACYGVLSDIKVARRGINSYLEGFLKEENVRLRPYRIRFEIKAPSSKRFTNNLTEWPKLRKSYKRFVLDVEPGSIFASEVIGILGPNGIGKTTFMKMLAGEIAPDSGSVNLKIRIAYKPQYLEAGEGLVASVLRKGIENYNTQLIRPLGLHRLLDRKLSELSGGELQRVAIARALSEDADAVLLDEPTAHLDVEQRLTVAKLINDIVSMKKMAAFVVDHDLLFIDYIADRLIVFDGEPGRLGRASSPLDMEAGMNKLLKELGITLRRDEESGRPRVNKPGSVKDREQKAAGKYYYV